MPVSARIPSGIETAGCPVSEKIDVNAMKGIGFIFAGHVVECEDDRIAGINEPALDIEVDTATGEAVLKGRFMLASNVKGGFWDCELRGRITDGLVTAAGLAKGSGTLDGAIKVDFRQVHQLATPAPCPDPESILRDGGLDPGKLARPADRA